jgi:acyl carrier protein
MTTLERVRKVVAEVMRVPADTLDPAARIEDLGETDSLTLAEIATALDAEFVVRVPSDDLAAARSVADLVALVDRLTAQSEATPAG